MNDTLSRIVRRVNDTLSAPVVPLICLMLLALWGVWAWHRHFDTYSQMVLNSISTLVTTQLLFLLLHSQSKDARANNLKTDEIIRVLENADNRYRHIETASDAALAELTKKVEEEVAGTQ